MALSWKDQELDRIHGSHRRERPEEVRKVECPEWHGNFPKSFRVKLIWTKTDLPARRVRG